MSTLRRHPVRRRKVALGALLGIAGLAAVILLAEWLRPGAGLPASPITPELDADPRVAVSCEAPNPREGLRESPPAAGRAATVSSTQLYDCPTTWDGRPVRFRGEVVGAVLQRGEQSWLQLNDDTYSGQLGPLPYHRAFRGGNGGVGVLVPTGLVERITSVGGPRRRGDIVEVSGVFRRVDRETSEVAIIRADRLRVVAQGATFPQRVEPARLAVATVLGALAVSLLLLEWRRKRG